MTIMGEFSIDREFTAAADTVFKELADFGGIGDWAPGIEGCTVEGEGVGAVRTIKMGAAVIKERLESLDESARSFSYSIIEGPMPVQNYLATVTVTGQGDGCRVDWGAKFDLPEGIPEDAVVKGVSGAYGGMLSALKKKLGEG
jgi:carbon monoxide dehydrogenase subunit G